MIPASMVALAQGASTYFQGRFRVPWRLHSAITGTAAHRGCASVEKGRARAISSARLNGSPRLHLRPINLVVYQGPYQREGSSRRRLPA